MLSNSIRRIREILRSAFHRSTSKPLSSDAPSTLPEAEPLPLPPAADYRLFRFQPEEEPTTGEQFALFGMFVFTILLAILSK
jgi:hypothetical protein